MVEWFGREWGAPICREAKHVPVPVGVLCSDCDEPIETNDAGFITDGINEAEHVVKFVQHYECYMRHIIGSASHQLKTCSCYVKGATETDPPELTKRQAARLAVQLWEQRQTFGDLT